ncbi:tyrosine-type recombinase/integrase [Photobacterium profundum]|uniref:Hypothetical phage integrase family n=1 Tax=Photobacterium profundum (strain SS9) TaxID=298386 RepID=Q6LHT8_PHOPR|nr:integrase family protein [Photobacterium profundum]CAG23142.1 hypothetical phage integrase family [Photobacterium profundum SS9]
MLTDFALKKQLNKKRIGIVREKDRDGLYIRVSPKGKIVFYIRYRYAGKAKDMDLGSYPLMSLKNARITNESYRALIEQGRDPKIEKQLAQQNISDDISFGELFELWYEKECKPTIKRHERIYKQIVFNTNKSCAKLPASKLTTHFWLDLLENIRNRAPAVSGKLLGHIKKIYAFGIRRRLVHDNPVQSLNAKRDLLVVNNNNNRFLTDEEIRSLFTYISAKNSFSTRNSLVIHFALIYGCRMGEMSLTKREHFDFDNLIWTLPPECHKTGGKTKKPLVRPIIECSVPMIKELFALSDNNEYLLSNQSGVPYTGTFWTRWPAFIDTWLKKNGYDEISQWGIHTLRKTMRTNISPLTLKMPHVAEKMLGHKLQGVWSVYDHYDYLDEQREVYTAWWNKLERILANTENVVGIKKA